MPQGQEPFGELLELIGPQAARGVLALQWLYIDMNASLTTDSKIYFGHEEALDATNFIRTWQTGLSDRKSIFGYRNFR